MKNFNKIACILVMLAMSMGAFADGVLVNGLYYYFDTISNTAQVTFPGETSDDPNPVGACYSGL